MTSSTERSRDNPDTSLLGVEIDNQFWSLMDRDYLSESDIRRASTKFIRDKARREEVQRWLRDVRDGKDEFKWRENGGPLEEERDPGANPVFMRRFREQIEMWYGEMVHAGDLDPLTRAAILSASSESTYLPYDAIKSILLSWVQPGNDGYIIGGKGAGKTAFGSLLGRLALDSGMKVLGAIPMAHPVDGYVQCTSGTQMLRTFCMLKKQGVTILVLLDEGFFSYSGETPLQSEVLNFRMFTRLFRKLGGALVDITQYMEDVPKELKKTAMFRVKKVDRSYPDRAHIQIKGKLARGAFEWSGRVKWIPDGPDVSLPYITDHIAAFIMDFEPKSLMEYLSSLNPPYDPFEETLRWLDERGLHFKPEQKRWFARRAVECGVSQGKVAEILGVSQPTIHRWVTREERELALDDEFLGSDE